MLRGWNGRMLLLILALRMGLVGITLAHPEGGVLTDSRSYLEMADGILKFGPLGDPEASDLHRTSGYPVFLALVQALTGTQFLGVVVAQLLGTGLACLVLVRIGSIAGAPEAGRIGAYVYALSPNAAMWSLTIMSESLFALLLTLALWTWLRSRSGAGIARMAGTGAILGLAAIVRPIGLSLIGVWAVVDGWSAWATAGRRKALARLLAVAGGFVLVIAPWVVRNWITYGDAEFSRIPWKAFVRFNLAYVLAEVEGIDRNDAAVQLEGRVNSWPDVWAFVQAHPVEFVDQQLRGIFRSTVGIESGAWARVVGLDLESQGSFGILNALAGGGIAQAWREAGELLRSGRGALLVLGLLAVTHTLGSYLAAARLGVASESFRGETRAVIVGLVLTTAYLLIAPGAAGQARFRVAAEPYLALLAGMGAVRWGEALAIRGAKKREGAAAPKA